MPTLPRPPARLRSGFADAFFSIDQRMLAATARSVAGSKRAIERACWRLERGLLWPLEERLGGWDRALRGMALAAVALLAVGAGVAGLMWAAPGRDASSVRATAATTTGSSIAAKPTPPPSRPARAAHLLHGAPPVFTAPARHSAAKVAAARALDASSAPKSQKAPSASISSAPAILGKPAGPAAIKVARKFSDAFVLYEIGKGGAPVRAAFTNTATPALAQSLLRRPPRQPATVRVPKAKVLNIVPGPSNGSVYTVSVSLLRVGLTSELRLEMENSKRGGWQVTDVIG